jgi:hypothetical protein
MTLHKLTIIVALACTALVASGCATSEDPPEGNDEAAARKAYVESRALAESSGGGDIESRRVKITVNAGGLTCYSVGTYGCQYNGDSLIRCADGAC